MNGHGRRLHQLAARIHALAHDGRVVGTAADRAQGRARRHGRVHHRVVALRDRDGGTRRVPRLARRAAANPRRGAHGDRARGGGDAHADRELRPLSRRARPCDALGHAGRDPARAAASPGGRRARLPRKAGRRAMGRLHRPRRGPRPFLQRAAPGTPPPCRGARARRRAHRRRRPSPGRSTGSRRSSCSGISRRSRSCS